MEGNPYYLSRQRPLQGLTWRQGGGGNSGGGGGTRGGGCGVVGAVG